eukprot:809946-Pleurochrysis_carterae.AAC.1
MPSYSRAVRSANCKGTRHRQGILFQQLTSNGGNVDARAHSKCSDSDLQLHSPVLSHRQNTPAVTA